MDEARKNKMMVQALTERMSQQVAQYEEVIATLRVELTTLSEALQELQEKAPAEGKPSKVAKGETA